MEDSRHGVSRWSVVGASSRNEMRYSSERFPRTSAPFFLQGPSSSGRLQFSISLAHLGSFLQPQCVHLENHRLGNVISSEPGYEPLWLITLKGHNPFKLLCQLSGRNAGNPWVTNVIEPANYIRNTRICLIESR